MDLVWIGAEALRAFHDPDSGALELLSSRRADEGSTWVLDPELSVAVDDDGVFCHLDLGAPARPGTLPLPERPRQAPVAEEASVELVPGAEPRWSYDETGGSLAVAFGDVFPESWARLGDNLVWLAIDDDARLAAIVVEGVSRDPAGRARAAWLADAGAW